MSIKKNDFILLEYTAKIKGTSKIFDTTKSDIAKANSLPTNINYEPLVICVGNRDVVPGLDDSLPGKDIGNFKIIVPAKDAFGEKNPNLVKIVNINVFNKQKINPLPGLQVNVDNSIGTIRSVAGGRVIVDFNHPLAGRDIEYDVEIIKLIENDEEKLIGLAKLYFNAKAELVDNIAKIDYNMPESLKKEFTEKIKKLIPSIKDVEFKK